jgi:hypothetical protein
MVGWRRLLREGPGFHQAPAIRREAAGRQQQLGAESMEVKIMMRKSALLVAAVALAAFAIGPSNSFAASKKKAEQSSSLKDASPCGGGACTAYTTPTYHYRRARKVKHHQG